MSINYLVMEYPQKVTIFRMEYRIINQGNPGLFPPNMYVFQEHDFTQIYLYIYQLLPRDLN